MKITTTSTTLAILCCISQSPIWAQNTTVTANISGLKDKQVSIGYMNGSTSKLDSVEVNDGKFVWTATIAEPQQVYLMFENMYYPFFAESGQIFITGIADSSKSFVVKGSKIQDEYQAYETSIKDLTDQEEPLYDSYENASKEEQSVIDTKLEKLRIQKRKRAEKYITDHPESFVSMHLVSERSRYGTDYSEVKKLYDLLSAKSKATGKGRSIAERLVILKRSAIGTKLIDLTQNDTTNASVSFASFKGKYVLVDFWASWCGPCRGENPNLLKAYNEYKDKNFTVVGVSLDDNGDRWKKAIREDKMPWTQVSDLKGWKNELSTYYGIQGIPSNFLVDPTGKIVSRDLRGEALLKKLDQLLN